ncbi:MAG: GNAT family N-acetyltransferase [Lentilitoribacter sp.]
MQNTAKSSLSLHGYSLAVENDFDFQSSEYIAFYDLYGRSAFQHPIWLSSFYKTIVPNRSAQPVIITVRGSDGLLNAVIPMLLREKLGVKLLEPAELGVTDYCAPLVNPDVLDDSDFKAQIHSLQKDILPSHDVLRVQKIRSEDLGLWQALFGFPHVQQDFSAHATPLSDSHENWSRNELSSSMRKSLRRKRNKFERETGAKCEQVAFEDVHKAMDELQNYRKGRFEGDLIQSEAGLEFYKHIAADGHKSGYARIYRLSLGDEVLGYTFGVTHKGIFYYLLIGCDYENFGKFSPGYLMYDYMIEDWIDRGGDTFDFTIGDEDFKENFGTKPTKMFSISFGQSMLGKVGLFAFSRSK